MLNHKFQALYGVELQNFRRITMLLKSYESRFVRKVAKTFTKEQFTNFLSKAPDSGEFIHIKAASILAYSGGLRCADLISITCEDLEFNSATGYWVRVYN